MIFDLALQRPRSLVTLLEEEPHVNPNTQTKGVLLPRSGRVLRYDQCALSGLTRRCGCRALAGPHGAAPPDLAPFSRAALAV
jgi:hypothetical protein